MCKDVAMEYNIKELIAIAQQLVDQLADLTTAIEYLIQPKEDD